MLRATAVPRTIASVTATRRVGASSWTSRGGDRCGESVRMEKRSCYSKERSENISSLPCTSNEPSGDVAEYFAKIRDSSTTQANVPETCAISPEMCAMSPETCAISPETCAAIEARLRTACADAGAGRLWHVTVPATARTGRLGDVTHAGDCSDRPGEYTTDRADERNCRRHARVGPRPPLLFRSAHRTHR